MTTMMKNTKQVIVIRKDLKMRRGKQIAQGAHASMKVLLDMMKISSTTAWIPAEVGGYQEVTKHRTLSTVVDNPTDQWLTGLFTKICVSVDSEEALLDIFEKASAAGIPCSLIEDAGLTEFGGVPTYTAVAVGPFTIEGVDKITKELPLL